MSRCWYITYKIQ